MPRKVFVLGFPGSGKSAACRIIGEYLKHKGVNVDSIAHWSDFTILRQLVEDYAENHLAEGDFELVEPDGFDLKPHAYHLLDKALQSVNSRLKIDEDYEWILIEFSRTNYLEAFSQLDFYLLRDAYFLFLEADRELCQQRVRLRTTHRHTLDDHVVSDSTFNTYYKSIVPLDIDLFCGIYGLQADQVHVIVNNDVLEHFVTEVNLFVDKILHSQKLPEPVKKLWP